MTMGLPAPLGEAAELDVVLDFLRGLGLVVAEARIADETLLPAMTVRDGRLLYDRNRPGWVGDLLHEAGHLAVSNPAIRQTLAEVGDDPAEEMATIAWSFAAALATGMPIGTLFHPAYKGGAAYLIEAFSNGAYIGLPMLQYWGMAARQDEDGPHFPAMRAWLRPG